jgi:STAM-binding protein
MTRYEQWRVDPSSVQPQPSASHPVPPLVAHRSINSHGTNTPTSSSTPSSSRSRASIPLRSRTPSPYEQSPTEDDRARRERVDALLREDPRRREDVYTADGARADQWHAREDDTRRRREWEEEGRRRAAEQRRLENDGILRRQQEADHAAQAARLGQPTGQNQGVTGPVMPVSSPVQYPSISASVTTAPAPSGPMTAYLQMPLESPTRCVILCHLWGVVTCFPGT